MSNILSSKRWRELQESKELENLREYGRPGFDRNEFVKDTDEINFRHYRTGKNWRNHFDFTTTPQHDFDHGKAAREGDHYMVIYPKNPKSMTKSGRKQTVIHHINALSPLDAYNRAVHSRSDSAKPDMAKASPQGTIVKKQKGAGAKFVRP